MANKRKGQTVTARDWVQHLRPFGKRDFWGQQRQDDKRIIAAQVEEALEPIEIEEWDDWDFDDEDYSLSQT